MKERDSGPGARKDDQWRFDLAHIENQKSHRVDTEKWAHFREYIESDNEDHLILGYD